ncbi:type II secretion system protein L [Shewanella sp. NFH-SH190041]|uniref:type II secretion system protein GspL n=1 Tax=Shewanella sp. NFH-SH190041 TaxID=2950245 RepID=UPI0021C2B8D1|nr:type II secretion system protein GspL [Shewanella sp. NFH-SH190041]BDM62649.1 type II secretion system protein L [Shewanella sp. NFH-SH190041]
MIERLFIRLGNTYEQPCSWLVWSAQEQEIIASGELANAGELGSLTERAGNRPVDVLVCSSALAMTQVTLPEKGQRQALKALPFMLEEELVDNVEQMHFVVGEREGEQLNVVAVSHEQMTLWLEWLQQAQLQPRVIVPDCLALPQVADCQWSAMQFGADCLLRTSSGGGHSIPMDWLAVVLPKLADGLDDPIRVATFTQLALPCRQHDITMAEQTLDLPMLVLARGVAECRVNLLSGRYQPKREYSRHLLLWRNAAIAAGIVLVLALVNKGLDIHQLGQQSAALKSQSEQIYRQAVPGSRRIVNLRTQLKSELNKLQGQGSGGEMFTMLDKLAPAFAKVPALKPDSLRFDGNRSELRMQVTAKNYAEIETFRELAGKQFNVSAGAMNSKHDAVTSTLTLRSL